MKQDLLMRFEMIDLNKKKINLYCIHNELIKMMQWSDRHGVRITWRLKASASYNPKQSFTIRQCDGFIIV